MFLLVGLLSRTPLDYSTDVLATYSTADPSSQTLSNANPMVEQDLTYYDIGYWLGLLELSTEDDGEPQIRGKIRHI